MSLILRFLAIIGFLLSPFCAIADEWKDTKALKTFVIGDEGAKTQTKSVMAF